MKHGLCKGSAPDECRGEDEKGERAWEDIDRGDVLPDMTGPSTACKGAARYHEQMLPSRVWHELILQCHEYLKGGG